MWYTTKQGKHVNTDWFDDDNKRKNEQIGANKKQVDEMHGKYDKRIKPAQRKIEDSIRENTKETTYYLDENGKELIKVEGDEFSTEYRDEDNNFNRLVEQAVWDGKDIHVTHNHPMGTIFSPSDIDNLCDTEYKSLSAVMPEGFPVKAFRLIREQPVSNDQYVIDVKTGTEELRQNHTSKYPPKYLQVDYYNHYAKVWEDMEDIVTKIENDYRYKKINHAEYLKQVGPYDRKITEIMSQWLKKHAADYGFTFIEE